MAESGVELLQYRNKRASTRQLFEMSNLLSHRLSDLRAGSARHALHRERPPGYRPAGLALAACMSARHDLGVEQARAIVGREPWVGVSTHTLDQVEAADRTSADYVAFGPVFATATKEQADPVVGLRLLAEARARTSKPLVAIGGITLERAAETYRAGADSLAVARDLLAAPIPRTSSSISRRSRARRTSRGHATLLK